MGSLKKIKVYFNNSNHNKILFQFKVRNVSNFHCENKCIAIEINLFILLIL